MEALSVPSVSVGAGTGLWNAVPIAHSSALTPQSGMSERVFPGVLGGAPEWSQRREPQEGKVQEAGRAHGAARGWPWASFPFS